MKSKKNKNTKPVETMPHACGTVAWLISELQKQNPKDLVCVGDHERTFYDARRVAVMNIFEGYEDDDDGERTVCICA